MIKTKYWKVIILMLVAIVVTPSILLMTGQSIYAQNQDARMLEWIKLDQSNGPSWQLSVNQNQTLVDNQVVRFSLPEEYEVLNQVDALVPGNGQHTLVITEDATLYQQQLAAYESYLQEKNIYAQERQQYQEIVDHYQQAVQVYNESLAIYEQELSAYQESILNQQIADAANDSVAEEEMTEEMVEEERPVTEAVSEPIYLEEPIAPVWDETIVDPSTITEPINPFDASKEGLWQIVLKRGATETYELLIPKEVLSTVLLLSTHPVKEINETYTMEASSTTTLDGLSMSYIANYLVESNVSETELSEEISSVEATEDETVELNEKEILNENLTSDDAEKEETTSNNGGKEFTAFPLKDQTYAIELFNTVKIEQNMSISFTAVVKNLDKLLTDGYSLEWKEELESSELGELTGELIVTHPNGKVDTFDILIEIIATDEDAVPVTSNRMMRMAARAPMNVNDLVKAINLDLKSSTVRNGNPNEVWMTSGDSVVLTGSYQVDNKVQAGDYFTVELGSVVRPGGLRIPETGPTLLAVNGNELATGVYDIATNTIRYTFTELVDRFDNISGNFNFRITQRREAHTFDKQPVQVAIKFAGESHEETMVFDYGRRPNSLTQLSTNSIDTKTGTYTSVAYINQMQRAFNTTSHVTISPDNFNISSIKFYRVPANYVLPDNFMPDYSKLIPITPPNPIRFNNGDLRYLMNPYSSLSMRSGERYVIAMTHSVKDSSANSRLTVTTYGGSTDSGKIYQDSATVSYTSNQSNSDGSGTVQLALRKLNEDGTLLLPAAEFTLYNQANGTVGKPIQAISTLGGEAVISNLEPGKTYYLFETKAPSGYQITSKGFKIQIIANSNKQTKELEFLLDEMIINPDGTYTQVSSSTYNWQPLSYMFDFVNIPYRTSLQFTKRQTNSNQPLEGAVFRLTKSEDPSFSQEVTSNSDGHVLFEGLTVGTYLLEEIQAPEGHSLLSQPMSFEVRAKDDNAGVVIGNEQESFIQTLNGQSVVYNTPRMGTITIIKMDGAKADSEANRLSEAVFQVTSDALTTQGNSVYNQTVTTNERGEISLKDLPLGRYQLKEIKAPLGYLLLDEIFEFELLSTGQSDEVELKLIKGNKNFISVEESTIKLKNYMPSEFPETGGIGTLMFSVVGLTLMIVASVLYWHAQRTYKGGD